MTRDEAKRVLKEFVDSGTQYVSDRVVLAAKLLAPELGCDDKIVMKAVLTLNSAGFHIDFPVSGEPH